MKITIGNNNEKGKGFLDDGNDLKKLQKAISEYMDKSVSFYDAGAEGFITDLRLNWLL